jgi:hypothetical protein
MSVSGDTSQWTVADEVDSARANQLQTLLVRNRQLVRTKVRALFVAFVSDANGDGSVVQEALRLLHSTQRSTLRTVAPSNYLVLLPKELLDQVRPPKVDAAVMACAVHLMACYCLVNNRCYSCCCDLPPISATEV